ncbi:hypothetical protein RRG08_003904 [Elysia crispata]|uniref:Uncharacterized protein n=1 Tax=Elysia crispata TaxID=231223 RepID=A0AAE0YU13_9GAST|nr:hypothetical protein RRG08_003904 [Elysia crispata]
MITASSTRLIAPNYPQVLSDFHGVRNLVEVGAATIAVFLAAASPSFSQPLAAEPNINLSSRASDSPGPALRDRHQQTA